MDSDMLECWSERDRLTSKKICCRFEKGFSNFYITKIIEAVGSFQNTERLDDVILGSFSLVNGRRRCLKTCYQIILFYKFKKSASNSRYVATFFFEETFTLHLYEKLKDMTQNTIAIWTKQNWLCCACAVSSVLAHKDIISWRTCPIT